MEELFSLFFVQISYIQCSFNIFHISGGARVRAGGEVVLALAENGQKPTLPSVWMCVVVCVYQEGGSAGYEPFRCGSSSHTLPCSLTHLVSEEVNRVSSHNCGLSREGKVGILLCGQVLN